MKSKPIRKMALLLASFVFFFAFVLTPALAAPVTKEAFSADLVLENPVFGEALIWFNPPHVGGFHIRDLPIDLMVEETSGGGFYGAGAVMYDGDWTADASQGGTGRVEVEGVITDSVEEYHVFMRIWTETGTFIISGDGIRITGKFIVTFSDGNGRTEGELTGVKFTYP